LEQIKVTVAKDVMCSFVDRCQCLRGICCLHLLPFLGVFAKKFVEISVQPSSLSAQNLAPTGKIFYLGVLLICVNRYRPLVEIGKKY
jgi:hypothetical protein